MAMLMLQFKMHAFVTAVSVIRPLRLCPMTSVPNPVTVTLLLQCETVAAGYSKMRCIKLEPMEPVATTINKTVMKMELIVEALVQNLAT